MSEPAQQRKGMERLLWRSSAVAGVLILLGLILIQVHFILALVVVFLTL